MTMTSANRCSRSSACVALWPTSLFAVTSVLFTACCASKASPPPSWEEFEVVSSNGLCVARVTVADQKGKKDRWDWAYSLSVVKNTDAGEEPVWQCPYQYDGDPGGFLSDDGSTFVRVRSRYYSRIPLVTIYRRGRLARQFMAKDLPIDRGKFKDGPSWLTVDASPAVFTLLRDGRSALRLRTRNDRDIFVDLESLSVIPQTQELE
jgi:hypothetical protein